MLGCYGHDFGSSTTSAPPQQPPRQPATESYFRKLISEEEQAQIVSARILGATETAERALLGVDASDTGELVRRSRSDSGELLKAERGISNLQIPRGMWAFSSPLRTI